MGYTYYSYLAFITPDSEADLVSLQARLQDFFGRLKTATKPQLTLAGNQLTVAYENYRFYIYYATEAYVHEEAAESAPYQRVDWAKKPIDAAQFATCNRRFELRGDPDPNMDYFNEHLYILETIEEFSGVIMLSSSQRLPPGQPFTSSAAPPAYSPPRRPAAIQPGRAGAAPACRRAR